ncbi:GNAT family N-acetyltransferase [Natronomonas halophila]|uniref:GNAT family N-acetyltransferase n=1 Tax=Natronomonas halophila TaxID=2747817 RepID=UPI0015B4184F|nr:GNAT family protein [Natronomonas halophila]QLD84915.1 GNAT family N-acetyltransferase [Natronomonas halophila]
MPGPRVASDDRVSLRLAESEDIPFLQRASADPDIRYPLGNPVRSREEIDVPGDGDTFVVCLEDDPAASGQPADDELRKIGQVSVMDADYKRPELGYWLVPSVHGEGYGTTAVSLAIDYVFREYDTPAVGAEAFAFNDASRGLLESLGFSEEGRRRKYMFVDGAHRDMVLYGLLRSEWDCA